MSPGRPIYQRWCAYIIVKLDGSREREKGSKTTILHVIPAAKDIRRDVILNLYNSRNYLPQNQNESSF